MSTSTCFGCGRGRASRVGLTRVERRNGHGPQGVARPGRRCGRRRWRQRWSVRVSNLTPACPALTTLSPHADGERSIPRPVHCCYRHRRRHPLDAHVGVQPNADTPPHTYPTTTLAQTPIPHTDTDTNTDLDLSHADGSRRPNRIHCGHPAKFTRGGQLNGQLDGQ